MGSELLRFRDEIDTGHRLIVDDAPEHHGVRVTVAGETERDTLTAALNLAGLECLIAGLTKAADRHRRELCPWCDSLGLIDGPDGSEFCTHQLADVPRMR
jgi:hypothetical protein